MLNEQQKKYILKSIHGLRVKKGLRNSLLQTYLKKGYLDSAAYVQKDIDKYNEQIENLKKLL